MSAVLVGEFEPNTTAWHAARQLGIGASEIAAVAGLSPWMSAFELWHRKAGNLTSAPDKPQFKWGHILEPVIAQEFADRHPIYRVIQEGTYAHSDRPWQMANTDRMLYAVDKPVSMPLEIKSSRFGDGYGQHGTDEVPLHVRCQVMQQMDVFGCKAAWVAVLIGGSDYREYVVDFDESAAAALRDAGAAFWESLQTGDEPPLDCSESTFAAVKELHPLIDGTDVEIHGLLYDRFHRAQRLAAEAADDARLAKSAVLKAMGNARRATVGETPVLRRQPNRSGVSLYDIGETA